MPDLPSGVRAVFTPRGRHELHALSQFENGGHYICAAENPATSSHMRPLDLAHVLRDAPRWHCGRPPSGRRNDAALYHFSQGPFASTAKKQPAPSQPLNAGSERNQPRLHESPIELLLQPPAPRALRLQPREPLAASRVIYLRAMDARSGLARGPRHHYLLNVSKIRDGLNFAHFLRDIERLMGRPARRVLSLAHEEVHSIRKSAPLHFSPRLSATLIRLLKLQVGVKQLRHSLLCSSDARRCVRCTRS